MIELESRIRREIDQFIEGIGTRLPRYEKDPLACGKENDGTICGRPSGHDGECEE